MLKQIIKALFRDTLYLVQFSLNIRQVGQSIVFCRYININIIDNSAAFILDYLNAFSILS